MGSFTSSNKNTVICTANSNSHKLVLETVGKIVTLFHARRNFTRQGIFATLGPVRVTDRR